jgi:hypothetical protein
MVSSDFSNSDHTCTGLTPTPGLILYYIDSYGGCGSMSAGHTVYSWL